MLTVLVVIFYFVASAITKYTGFSVVVNVEKKDFNKCLEEKEIVLYINSNNPIETLDDFETKDFLGNVEVFNCLLNKFDCINRGIDYFPTWVIDDEKISGDISIDVLAKVSGCDV